MVYYTVKTEIIITGFQKPEGSGFQFLIVNKEKTSETILPSLMTWFTPPMSRRKTNCIFNLITSSINKRLNELLNSYI